MKQKQTKRFFALVAAMALIMAVAPVVWAEQAEQVNINKASIEELMQLKKIGQKYAERIVQYRENHGPFEKPADITQVQGIGTKTFELNKDRIAVR